MAVLLGLVSALVYGAADFTGGVATRRNPAVVVVAVSQAAGFALLLVALPFLPAGRSGTALWVGAIAGVAGGLGVLLLYRGLAIGRMSVVAPITGVLAAAVPVVVGLLAGERPDGWALLGVAIALAAIVLVSAAAGPAAGAADEGLDAVDASEPDADPAAPPTAAVAGTRPGLVEALGAGVAFGAFFVLLDAAPADAGLWPLVGARIASVGGVVLLALARRLPLRPAAGTTWLVMLAGVLDMAANVAYLIAVRAGLLSLVGVLVSLYPAVTVLLARVVLGERLRRVQLAGVACAAAGVVLIAA